MSETSTDAGGEEVSFDLYSALAWIDRKAYAPLALEDQTAFRFLRRFVGDAILQAGSAAPTAKGAGEMVQEHYPYQQPPISAMLAASPTPPAGAAGGGSGDLAALSAGATPGTLSVSGSRRRYDEPSCVIVDASSCAALFALATGERGKDTLQSLADAKFLAGLWNAYRSGRLIEAPTPDLGAQGEPVAWAWDCQDYRGRWHKAVSLEPPVQQYTVRHVRPLYEAPAASRPAPSAGEIARIIESELLRYVDLDDHSDFRDACADIAAAILTPSQPHAAQSTATAGGRADG